MNHVHRKAPDPEWVEMYRRGLSSTKIAEVAQVPASTVRYHVHLAVMAESALRVEHRAARKPPRRKSSAGAANLAGVIELFEVEHRLPSSGSEDARERALASWLARRRQDLDKGTLIAEYRNGLLAVPGWETLTRTAKDEHRWQNRLSELMLYRAAAEKGYRVKYTLATRLVNELVEAADERCWPRPSPATAVWT